MIQSLLILMAFSVCKAQESEFWYNIISTADSCQYYVPDQDIGYGWISKEFDDSSWSNALSGIGYADGDDNTELIPGSVYSVYIRYRFNMQDIESLKQVILDMDYDDGFVAYLNGTEIANGNISKPYSWNMLLDDDHEARMYRGLLPERWRIEKSVFENLIVGGENVLVIEVHNHSPGSSDLSSNCFLHMAFDQVQSDFRDVLGWFETPEVLFSHLPIVTLNTAGVSIPDEPKIPAQMGIIFTEGDTSGEFDSPNVFSGRIAIERRGESSSGFPKKQYAFETRTASGTNLNVSLLGMPPENDWILYAPYSDKSMIKNVLTYTLSRQMGNYAPRTRYVELILNGEYQGIYILTEKIKQDKGRIDIAKLLPEDIADNELTGGFIIRNDKITDLLPLEYWNSPVPKPYGLTSQFQYYDPKYEDLIPVQRTYIRNHMKLYEEVLTSSDFTDSLEGYRKYTNVLSFMDMMFINELAMNVDCYHFSTYFYKDKDSDGGKLYSGPVWDYNIAWGNVNYGNVNADDGFIYTRGGRMYYWKRMMEDPWYANAAYYRWDELRSTILSWENIEHIIDSCINLMGTAIERNYDRWPVLGTYIWPNVQWPDTYEEEIVMLKTFISDRLPWLDGQWSGRGNLDDRPPRLLCVDDQYVEPGSDGRYVVKGKEFDPWFVWDDFDVVSLSNNLNGKRSLENVVIPWNTTIEWTATDTRGQQTIQSFDVYILANNILSPEAVSDRLKIYPNPATDFFVLDCKFSVKKVIIHSIDGKILEQFQGNNERQIRIDASALNRGTYLVRVLSENNFEFYEMVVLVN